MNRNVVEKITYNEYKDVLLSNICLRHLMNRIQSKDYTIKTYEIKKTTLPCFDDNMYIYLKKLFYPAETYCFNFFSSQESF